MSIINRAMYDRMLREARRIAQEAYGKSIRVELHTEPPMPPEPHTSATISDNFERPYDMAASWSGTDPYAPNLPSLQPGEAVAVEIDGKVYTERYDPDSLPRQDDPVERLAERVESMQELADRMSGTPYSPTSFPIPVGTVIRNARGRLGEIRPGGVLWLGNTIATPWSSSEPFTVLEWGRS